MTAKKKETLEDISAHIQETQIEPIAKKLRGIETRTEETQMRKWFEEQFNERMKHDVFRNRITNLFNEFLKGEHFLNKVDDRARKIVDLHAWKRSAVIGTWVVSTVLAVIIGGAIQKFLFNAS